jgi:hypothetical protein
MDAIQKAIKEFYWKTNTTSEFHINKAVERFTSLKKGEYFTIWYYGHELRVIECTKQRLIVRKISGSKNLVCDSTDQLFEHLNILVTRAILRKEEYEGK